MPNRYKSTAGKIRSVHFPSACDLLMHSCATLGTFNKPNEQYQLDEKFVSESVDWLEPCNTFCFLTKAETNRTSTKSHDVVTELKIKH